MATYRFRADVEEKLGQMASALNMSRVEMLSLLIEAVDQVELTAMRTEQHSVGRPRARIVTIRQSAGWKIRV